MGERPKHPSGRPVRKTGRIDKVVWRVPDKGYVTPRQQDSSRVNAIGFTVGRLPGQEDDDHE